MATENIGVRVIILGLGEFRRASRDVRSELDSTQRKIQGLTGVVSNFGTKLSQFGSALSSMGRTMTFSFTLPLVTAMTGLIGSGIRFEDAFAGVGKTVDGVAIGFKDVVERTPELTRMFDEFVQAGIKAGTFGPGLIDEAEAFTLWVEQLDPAIREGIFASEMFGQLTDQGKILRADLLKLTETLPISATELANIGQVAGQLGVPANQIKEFTEIVAMMGIATDLSSTDAAFALARMANTMGVESKDLVEWSKGMSSAIVALGNSTAATEPEIVNMMMRITAAGRLTGLTEQEMLGLSATMVEFGIKAERGGTAASRVLQEMQFAILDGGDSLEAFAKVSGVSAEEFAKAFSEEPMEAVALFLGGMQEFQKSGEDVYQTLLDMGLSSVRAREVINLLGPELGILTENTELANRAWREQIALEEEVIKRKQTIASQLIFLRNAFVRLGVHLFDLYRKDIENFIQGLQNIIDKFQKLEPATQKNIIKFALIAAALGPLLIIIGSIAQGIGALATAFAGLSRIVTGTISGLIKLVPMLISLAPIILPLIAIVGALYLAFKTNFLGIADLVNGVVDIIKKADIVGKVKEIVEQIRSGDFVGAWDTFRNAVTGAFDLIKDEIVPKVKEWFESAKTTIQAEAPGIKDEIVAKVKEWADEFVAWVPGAIDDLKIELDKIRATLSTWISEQSPKIKARLLIWADAFLGWVVIAGTFLRGQLGKLIDIVTTWIAEQIPKIKNRLLIWADAFVGWVIGAIPLVRSQLGKLIDTITAWISEQIPKIKARMLIWADAFLGWVISAVPLVREQLGKLLTTITSWISEQLPKIKARLLIWADAFIGWVPTAITFLRSQLGQLIGVITTWITEQIPKIKARLLIWADAFIGWVPTAVVFLRSQLNQLIGVITSWVSEQAPKIKTRLLIWADTFLGWVVTAVTAIPGQLSTLIDTVTGWISEQSPKIKTQLVEWANQFIDWASGLWPQIQTDVDKVADEIKHTIEIEVPNIKNKLKKWTDQFVDWASNLWDMVRYELDNFVSEVKHTIELEVPNIRTKLKAWKEQFTVWVTDAWTDLKPELDTLFTQMTTWIAEQIPVLIVAIHGWAQLFWNWVKAAGILLVIELFGYMTTLGNWITNTLVPKLEDYAPKIVAAFFKWIRSAKDETPGEMDGLATTIENETKNLESKLANAAIELGKAFVRYMIGGGMSGVGQAIVDEIIRQVMSSVGLGGGGEGVAVPTETAEQRQQREEMMNIALHGVPGGQQWGGRYGLSPFMAGEKGPELVFPRSGGFVASNHLLRNLANTMMNPLSTGGYNRYNNSYAPNFYTTPTPEVLQANRDMYSEWVIAGMATQ